MSLAEQKELTEAGKGEEKKEASENKQTENKHVSTNVTKYA